MAPDTSPHVPAKVGNACGEITARVDGLLLQIRADISLVLPPGGISGGGKNWWTQARPLDASTANPLRARKAKIARLARAKPDGGI